MSFKQLCRKINEPDLREPVTRFLIAGDFCPQGMPERYLSEPHLFWPDIVKLTAVHDIAILNLECPLTRSDERILKVGPHLKADPQCAQGIRAGGFQIASLANNHMMDFGEQGLADTLNTCHQAGLKTVGAGENFDEASSPLYVDINGKRCAVISVAGHEFSIAADHRAGVWPLDPIQNYYQIQEARKQADFVLLIVHAGIEHYPLPSPRLADTCRFFASAGAHAIICMHSHVPGGYEIWEGVPIIYGTGNFIFNSNQKVSNLGWYTGYLVSLKVQGSAVLEIELLPYHQCRDRIGIDLMNADEADCFAKELDGLNEIISNQDRLSKSWQDFCDKNQDNYLGMLFSSNRVEAYLWYMGVFTVKNVKKRIPRVLDLIQNEGHQEVLVNILDKIVHPHGNKNNQ